MVINMILQQEKKYGFSTTNGGSGMHWNKCKNCDAKKITNCIKSETENPVKPTCTQKGKFKYTCNICEAYWYVSIPALGHNFNSEGKCTRTGCNVTKNDNCNHVYTEEYENTDKNTCTLIRRCTDCGKKVEVPRKHTANHANNGVCGNCGEKINDHTRTTGVPLNPEWEITENSHRQRLECYGCKETGESGNCILRR